MESPFLGSGESRSEWASFPFKKNLAGNHGRNGFQEGCHLYYRGVWECLPCERPARIRLLNGLNLVCEP